MSKRFEIAFEEVQEPINACTIEEIDEQHHRIAVELEEDSQELDYQSDLIEGLESLTYLANKIDTPTPTEVALFRVAANMAVAGTKQSAQNFLPAMESNKPIAMEDFTDKIKETIKTIIAKLQEWWKKFKEFIKNIFSNNKKKKDKLDENIKQAESSSLKEQAEEIIDINKNLLTTTNVKNKKVSVKELEDNINEFYNLKPHIEKYSDNYLKIVSAFYTKLDSDPSTIDEVFKEYVENNNKLLKDILFKNIISGKEYLSQLFFMVDFWDDLDESSSYSFRSPMVENNNVELSSSKEELAIFIKNIQNRVIVELNYSESIEQSKTELYRIANKKDYPGNSISGRKITRVINESRHLNSFIANYNVILGKIIDGLNSLVK